MPSRINGIATWYYGKRNRVARNGTCRQCRRGAILTSCDTWHCICVAFIPLIALCKLHTMDQCAACRRHFVVPWKKWQEAQQKVDAAIEAYQAQPDDARLAQEALAGVAALADAQRLSTLAPLVQEHLAHGTQALLALAQVREGFGEYAEVTPLLAAAAALSDDQRIHEALAANLIHRGMPDEAAPYVRPIIEQRNTASAALLYALAQAYRIRGTHERALECFAHATDL